MSSPSTNGDALSNPSLWERVSTWVSENKAVAYTIAGTVVVITAAGTVYYLSDSQKTAAAATEKRKSKKERRKEKQEAREAEQSKEHIKLQDEEAGKSNLSRV